jgi:hypothetical protein
MTDESILTLLARRYLELEEACYRVSVVFHDQYGRFQKGHRVRRPHPALVKKVDLDAALSRVYERFFGLVTHADEMSTSTSNSLCQGSDTRARSQDADQAASSRSE